MLLYPGGLMWSLFRSLKRRRLAARPFPEAWRPIIARRYPRAEHLPPDESERLLTHLKVFAWEKRWEGAHGLEITDEMKVVVSGAAARLARNLPLDVYDGLTTVLLYESHFKGATPDGITYGEAHRLGLVVLSWDAVLKGLSNPRDGRDTALHEFAHVLDLADGAFDGTPALHDADDYRAWTRAFSDHYLRLRRKPQRGLLREYGATNEAEFFAVATEQFFENGARIYQKAPALYLELVRFYRVDPAGLASAGSAPTGAR